MSRWPKSSHPFKQLQRRRLPQPSSFTRPFSSSTKSTTSQRRRSSLLPRLDTSISTHHSYRNRQQQLPAMVQRDSDRNWVQDPTRANAARNETVTWDPANRQYGGTFFNPSASNFAPHSGPGSSSGGYGSYGLAEVERSSHRAQTTRSHAAARERAAAAVNGNQIWPRDHVQYVQDRERGLQQWQQIQQAVQQQVQQGGYFSAQQNYNYNQGPPQNQPSAQQYRQQQQQQQQQQQRQFVHQQQFVQQQVHQGGFYPTPPNFNNQPFAVPLTNGPGNGDSQGNAIPTPPRTNSPPGGGNKVKRGKKAALAKALTQQIKERDIIQPPSKASGGIPEPTPAYEVRTLFLPRRLPQPQPLLIVIDLNGTLLHRPSSHKSPRHFIARPGAREFVNLCMATYRVMIWSSARPQNVTHVTEKLLFEEELDKLVAVWGRDMFRLSPEDYNKRVQCYKRLSYVWASPRIQATYPLDHDDRGIFHKKEARERMMQDGSWKAGSWNQGNTVLIDDSKEKSRSEPCNAIEISEFMGDEKDDVLPQVLHYLETLAIQADVSTYIRAHPFKLAEKSEREGGFVEVFGTGL